MVDFANSKIQAFNGPKELGAPDDLEEVIIDFIDKSQKSLDIAVQELDSELIAQALLDASWRGISINIVLEQNYLAREKHRKAIPKQGESFEEATNRVQWSEYRRPKNSKTNRDILSALLRNGINAKADYNPKTFHQKFIIRDYRKSKKKTSAVLTGSTNFTYTGTHKNLNNIVIFHNHSICKVYMEEFDEIQSGTFGEFNERHKKKPKTFNIEGVPVRILFAPDDAPELEIIKQMLKSEKRIDFAIFTFSGSSGIDDAMTILNDAKRNIQGAIDPIQGEHWWSATKWLHNKGIKVYVPKKVSGFGKLHHKLMVIDDDIVIAGSMNYTAPANEYNDENIFVIGSPYNLPPDKGGPVNHTFCAEIAGYFRKEIGRIIQTSDLYKPH